jgi:hypothetical protein
LKLVHPEEVEVESLPSGSGNAELTILKMLDGNRSLILCNDACNRSIKYDVEVLAIAHRLKEGRGAAHAHPIAAVGLGDSEADNSLSVEVFAYGVADLRCSIEDVRGDGWLPGESLYVQRPALSVIDSAHSRYLRVVLRTEKVREYLTTRTTG